jgi:hypothetical protein
VSAIPISWRKSYVVAVQRGQRTRYYDGIRLKEAVAAARLEPGDRFAFAKFERGPVQWAEIGAAGRTYIHGPMTARTKTA